MHIYIYKDTIYIYIDTYTIYVYAKNPGPGSGSARSRRHIYYSFCLKQYQHISAKQNGGSYHLVCKNQP